MKMKVETHSAFFPASLRDDWTRAILITLASLALLFFEALPLLAQPQPLAAKGIENFYQLSERIYSGSAPEGEVAFAELQKRGIKTIISVDGSKPEVEMAKKYGMQYAHLPIGYDGVPTNQAVKQVKAAGSMPPPIFVHCHHGLHRGVAGAAVICMGVEHWSADEAVAWMHQAGTATNYMGLYRTVAEFHPPTAAELEKIPTNFQEKTEVSSFVDTMVEIDNRFDNLKLVKKAGYQPPPTHPAVSPAHEALLLAELFKELWRSPETAKRKPDLQKRLAEAEQSAKELLTILGGGPVDLSRADSAFQKVSDACASCHKAHRN